MTMTPEVANYFGFSGMACIIFAYAYTTARQQPNPFVQHGVNLLGAALLTVSLLVNTNPASMAAGWLMVNQVVTAQPLASVTTTE